MQVHPNFVIMLFVSTAVQDFQDRSKKVKVKLYCLSLSLAVQFRAFIVD